MIAWLQTISPAGDKNNTNNNYDTGTATSLTLPWFLARQYIEDLDIFVI